MDQNEQAATPNTGGEPPQPLEPVVIVPQETATATPSAEMEASPTPMADPLPVPSVLVATPLAPQKKAKNKLIIALALTGGILLLLGGAAAAYVGVILPNKPENALQIALYNSAMAQSGTYEGKLSYESLDKDTPVKAANIEFDGRSNVAQKAFDAKLNITASGIAVPLELRAINKSLYFKFGDLSNITALTELAGPEFGAIATEVSKKISNQWVEVDETLLKQAELDCAVGAYSITQQDAELLANRYREVSFATITSTTKDTVNGMSAKKFDIVVDNKKLEEYSKNLDGLSFVKKLQECEGTKSELNDSSDLSSSGDTTPFSLWVADKKIVKFAASSTEASQKKDNLKVDVEVVFGYGAVEIQKPDNTKPFMQLFGEISSSLGGGINDNNALSSNCAAAYENYANSQGTSIIPVECETGGGLLGVFDERLRAY